MAIIQNSAVIQKLVDELELSPATEKIPTELAEKILPVFQVNSEEVEAIIKPKYFLWQDVVANDSDKTLTVPDGHTYVMKSGYFTIQADATVGNRFMSFIVSDKAGNIIWNVENDLATTANNRLDFLVSPNHWDTVGMANVTQATETIPIPMEFVLKEGYTVRIADVMAVAAATDDLGISLMVEDIED